MIMTEDKVRNNADRILGFSDDEQKIKQGTGQITTFNQLGFSGINDKPDGWYLPVQANQVAIILETKASDIDISKKEYVDELLKNVRIAATKYSKVVGILYNGTDTRVFKNEEEISTARELQHKRYYINLFEDKLDTDYIYNITQKINSILHFKFGMTDLQDRMIFTACALVAQRFRTEDDDLQKLKGLDYNTFHNAVFNKLKTEMQNNNSMQSEKLQILLEEYDGVRLNVTEDRQAIKDFIDNVCKIADLVNSNNWNGEDVMAIFFNEFNRYRGKSDAGQVFTPDHIANFMYRLIEVDKTDRVLDATCGSGTFLVKAMSNMIKEAGGVDTEKAAEIKTKQLFGIELYRKVFALACANMLIHKDGNTNLAQLNAFTDEAGEWIKEKNITKVLMNPPYERKYGCMKIVKNVLDNVPPRTKCAFILPDKKLEKDGGKKLLKNHKLTHIIKLPENLFFGVGVTTSIFVFESGVPQNGEEVFGCYIEDDGLVTVKNKGRQDVKGKWSEIEDYWIDSIKKHRDEKYHTDQWINPDEHLSYQMPEKPFEIYEEDFVKTVMDYEMFKRGIDVKDFKEKLIREVMYSSDVVKDEDIISIKLKRGEENE